MNNPITAATQPEPISGYRINALTGAATVSSRALSAPLSSEKPSAGGPFAEPSGA